MTSQAFSEEQIIKRIKFDNPWWESGNIEEYYSSMKRRGYFELFKKLVDQKDIRRAVVLMGPRRVGKTVMLYHTIQNLIDSGIDPKKICYLSIETPIYNNLGLERLFELCRKTLNDDNYKGFYVFFDEIQYLKNWEVHLKSLVDSFIGVKFIVSGSAAAALKLKSIESGAGRFTEFLLPPLSFEEYLRLKNVLSDSNEKKLFKIDNIDKLNSHFVDYINYGGYPEVIFSEKIQSDPGRYIRNDIVDKVLLRDLPSLYGIQNVQELNSLFTYIAYHSGNEISLDTLSSNSGIAKNTIKKYINYLEAAFLIKIINRIDLNAKQFKRANFFKIYLTNPSLRSALFSPISKHDVFFGNMVETAIFSNFFHDQIKNKYYARWKSGEVDLVTLNEKLKPESAVEIKWSNRFVENPKELKSLFSFMKKHNIHSYVTTIDKSVYYDFDDDLILFVPSSIFCLVTGSSMLKEREKDITEMIKNKGVIEQITKAIFGESS